MEETLGPFCSPHYNLGEDGPYPRSLLELRLIALSAAIRRKEDWHIKRLNADIVARWADEAIAQHITPAQFKVVFDELECYDKLRCGCIEVAVVDGVWKAQGLIPEALASRFSQLVARLSNIPDDEKDWHPGSDEVVLDLIHPGLYLFVSGVTRTINFGLPSTHGGIPTHLPNYHRLNEFSSTTYQWIPTPVEVDADNKVRFLSYINNLHPKHHSELYDVLSDILTTTIPLFERTLGFLKNPRRPKIDLQNFAVYVENAKSPRQLSSEDDEAFDQRWEDYWENRPFKPIPIEDYTNISEPHPITLGGRRLQIIVKMQEIHLTPDKPSYEGGVWHVEGMKNEGIVATAIYYYDCTNVSKCTLSFREAVGAPDYEQNDNRGVEAIYGLLNEGPLVQELGSVITEVYLVFSCS
jgi:hypothetical protein